MAFLNRPFDEISKDDLQRLVAAETAEDSTIEFKREVEIDAAGRVRDASRNDIAREIVAFANAQGGTLVIGIEESDDDPKRAKSPMPFPNCYDLAERLRRAVFEIIEPKLPMLHSKAVLTEEDGRGMIVFVVPQSRRAPHRVETLRDCFRRTGSESRKMTMREIQELTLAVAAGAGNLERRLHSLAESFNATVLALRAQMDNSIPHHTFCEIRFSAVPLADLWLGKIIGKSELAPVMPSIGYEIFGKRTDFNYPWGRETRTGHPIVRGHRRTTTAGGRSMVLFDEIHCDGAVTIAAVHLTERLYFGWILSQISALLCTIDMVRTYAGAPDAEYAVQLEARVSGQRMKLVGEAGFFDDEYRFRGDQHFPTYSYGTRSERSLIVNEIAQDVVHAAGCQLDLDLKAEIRC
ncbi:ATP-binding protein [Bradyrhizobium japonicum]|uniref:AlbA family DNA-binding domain-containing protein n=1 Tax=Bradyrhizobium japonicum TaxID=375 RepID=UPI001BADECCD|nr:ATP-binding protein [Bradyrhizobium japonicum]MBR0803592.1 ATP-binding protein [Bradyrhizobium japonicum]